MVTWPGYQRPPPAGWATYTYPGAGTVGFRFEETAAESPFTPGEKVGIPAGTLTGPYLYVMFDGPFMAGGRAAATGASLTGPDGPVELAVVDNTTPDVGSYLPTGVELIPLRPLRPRAAYTAAVTAVVRPYGGVEGQPPAYSWTFTTAGRPNTVRVDLRRDSRRPSRAELSLGSDAPSAQVTLDGPGGAVLHPTLVQGFARVRLPVPGRWRACATSGGALGEWEAGSDCASRSFPARLDMRLPRRVRGQRLRVSVPRVAVGRRAKVLVYMSTRRAYVGTFQRRVRLRRHTTIRLPAPAGARRWDVTLTAGGFRRGGVAYERLELHRRYRSVR
jgi:hypothetical protein